LADNETSVFLNGQEDISNTSRNSGAKNVANINIADQNHVYLPLYCQSIIHYKHALPNKVTLCLFCRAPPISGTFTAVYSSETTKYLTQKLDIASRQFTIPNRSYSKYIFGPEITMLGHPPLCITMASYQFSQDFPNREFFLTGSGFEAMRRQYIKDFLEMFSGNTSGSGRDSVSMRVNATNFRVTLFTRR
jgi:hypothetical protein